MSKISMLEKISKIITSKILELQDENECWNVLGEGDRYFPALNYYVPNYKSTLWTLILLADINTDIKNKSFLKPLKIISDHFFDKQIGIFTIGKSHFPIPCLNGNMLYLYSYFEYGKEDVIDKVVDFFSQYQRFDDGDFVTPSSFPYCFNRSCYGKHTCYWGVVKLLKGLSFIRTDKRSDEVQGLISKCIDFILLHEVCFSSHNKSEYIHTNIKHLTFPNMYQGDFLEILWLLKREQVKSVHIQRALNLLKNKMGSDLTWKIERQVKDLIIPIGKKSYGNEFVTNRAREVLEYYQFDL
ncbi:hypothetical protein [Pseudobacteroides cellulosolvens]|uniref:Prenyltransferase n=1 Tax=Pseudobacteroides cellulosolvens ATCC 35603 = DSM 2933 TaxID=398512 RepID=A0A0L6JNK7_9FIRM|nr:hypothetical protein [Pseudobacteroides cellulosolvens]KNY26937.1 hypothetical protein Bccel_2202 [Pseudobacteroides cellulosolvens ATCC 35603 = DSM 2933]